LLLGTAYLVYSGHASAHIAQTLGPAGDLAKRLAQDDKLVPILFYLWMHHTARCEFGLGLELVEELDNLARSTEDSYALMVARNVECETQCWMGNFKQAQRVEDEGLAVYDPAKAS
jgi:hypothetical protein